MARFRLSSLALTLALTAIETLATAPARANDREITGIGGRVKAMTGENKQIRMVDETVTIDVYPKYYDVVATFHFTNDGGPTTVTMGFPESGHGGIESTDYVTKSAFTSFATSVDGQPVKAARLPAHPTEEEYTAYWTKEVSFAAGAKHTVQVKYRSPVGVGVMGIFAEYPFTGGNWKGTVADSLLTVKAHLDENYAFEPRYSEGVQQSGNAYTFHRQNWQAEQTVQVVFAHDAYTMDKERLGAGMDVAYDCDALWQMRNTIFARHGRIFQDPTVRAYFANKRWYHPDPHYTDARLNAIERANVQLLQAAEAKNHCR